MKIFGIEFTTKNELKSNILELEDALAEALGWRDRALTDLCDMKRTFPFMLGQTVYDVQLRNDKGRYATKNVSLEHSIINEVVVDTKNYFNLVGRYEKNDVFVDYESAREFLENIVVNK